MEAITLKHFNIDEFACPCCGKVEMNPVFLRMLDDMRGYCQFHFHINSGYRCTKHNQEVGSTSTNHTSGKAADVMCTSDLQRMTMIRAFVECNFSGLGIGKNYLHIDLNHTPLACWLYNPEIEVG